LRQNIPLCGHSDKAIFGPFYSFGLQQGHLAQCSRNTCKQNEILDISLNCPQNHADEVIDCSAA